ncbi:hypothetical protein BJ508DRAFT_336832 [Ascobolus immersus RN42]|uniref:DUF6532 domain-containing protein n=1 Tax=Ascobolus immersus RN42 TaxID=1160509 RepID=A0A3N4HBD8_ASCIM|nr:hypothetical protein BJ508DRAFT_336832 [Ascobolus immersus RN42]
MSQDTTHSVASTAGSTLTYAEPESRSLSLDDHSFQFDEESFLGSQLPECPESPGYHSSAAGLIPRYIMDENDELVRQRMRLTSESSQLPTTAGQQHPLRTSGGIYQQGPPSVQRSLSLPSGNNGAILNPLNGFLKAFTRPTAFGKTLANPTDKQPTDNQPTDNQPTGKQRTDKQSRKARLKLLKESAASCKQKDLSEDQTDVFNSLKRFVVQELVSRDAYQTNAELSAAMFKRWELEVHGLGLMLEECPFEPIPKNAMYKMFGRVRSGAISDTCKSIHLYYDIPTTNGKPCIASVERLLKNHTYLAADPSSDAIEGQLRYFHRGGAEVIANHIIGTHGVTIEDIRAWLSVELICFAFTVVHFALQKMKAGAKRLMVEEHIAIPVYKGHKATFLALYSTTIMRETTLDAFYQTVMHCLSKQSAYQVEIHKADCMDLEKWLAAQQAYLAKLSSTEKATDIDGRGATADYSESPQDSTTQPSVTLTSSEAEIHENRSGNLASDVLESPTTTGISSPKNSNMNVGNIPSTPSRRLLVTERFSPYKSPIKSNGSLVKSKLSGSRLPF